MRAVSGTPVQLTGPWTPTDASGAGLAFTAVNCAYTVIGNMCFVYGTLTFPTTASAAACLISGLPFPVPNTSYAKLCGAFSQGGATYASLTSTQTVINSSSFIFCSAGANFPVKTNVSLTGLTLLINFAYPLS